MPISRCGYLHIYGDKCRLSHDVSNICFNNAKGEKCKYEGKCRFVHVYQKPTEMNKRKEKSQMNERVIEQKREIKQETRPRKQDITRREEKEMEERRQEEMENEKKEKLKDEQQQNIIKDAIKEQINFLKEGIILEMRKDLEEIRNKMQQPVNKYLHQTPGYYRQMTRIPTQIPVQQQYYYTK